MWITTGAAAKYLAALTGCTVDHQRIRRMAKAGVITSRRSLSPSQRGWWLVLTTDIERIATDWLTPAGAPGDEAA